MNSKIMMDGISYLEKVRAIDPETSKLRSEVIFNMVCIGIEAVLTGVLIDHSTEVIDHSGISKLLRTLEKYEPVSPEWIAAARLMNRYNSYCSLEPVAVKIPNATDLQIFIDFGADVELYAIKQLEKLEVGVS